MAAKAILVISAQALFIQCAFSQCIGRAPIGVSGIATPCGWPSSLAAAAPSWAYDRYPGTGCAGFYPPTWNSLEFTATSGGSLPVTSSSAIAPTGISILSENVYEGTLYVIGELPFVGTTAVEGVVASVGSGAINHGCGNGLNAMSALSGTSSPATVATLAGPTFGAPGLAFDGLFAPGCAGLPYAAYPFAYDRLPTPRLPCDGLAYTSPIDAIEITPTRGGALPVASASAIPPTGIALTSDNAYEGALAVGGDLPFVGTVGVEGVVPSAGAGAINHACGNGRNAMASGPAAYGRAPGLGPLGAYSPSALAAPSLGLRRGWAGKGCGCMY